MENGYFVLGSTRVVAGMSFRSQLGGHPILLQKGRRVHICTHDENLATQLNSIQFIFQNLVKQYFASACKSRMLSLGMSSQSYFASQQ
jgi:hypothetical protein